MADVSKLVPFILKWEGGWADDPTDLGGATMKGITIGTFIHYRKLKGLPPPTKTDLKNISDAEWMDVLKTLYWDKWQADKIVSQSVANCLVDWVWASGAYGIKTPQRLLGVVSDGIVGAKTIEALNRQDAYLFWLHLIDERKIFIEKIIKYAPEQIKFKQGWLNRINDLRFVQ
jgi:lysozyme family protein